MTTLMAPASSSADARRRPTPAAASRSPRRGRRRCAGSCRRPCAFAGVAGLPAWRASKCSTRSLATSARRRSVPTIASSRAHLLLSFSRRCTSSPSVTSSNSASILGLLCLGQLDLGEPALVVDGHRGAVLDGALDVVDADVVAEDGARVLVGELDRRAGEADERGVRQRVAHVPGEAVDEVVLAAVRLVGDDDDVAPVESSGWRSPLSSGMNFWIVVKTTPPEATCSLSRRSSRLSACTGGWRSRSWQRGEGAEELVVEVVAVGEHDERGVRHLRAAGRACRRRRPWRGSCRCPACARRRRRGGRR